MPHTTVIPPGSTIGILGEGQLGRMIALKSYELGYNVIIYGDKENGPAYQVTNQSIINSYNLDVAKDELIAFAKKCDVITLEFENVPSATLDFLSNYTIVAPGHRVLAITQDRTLEKHLCKKLNIPTTHTLPIEFSNTESLQNYILDYSKDNNLKFPGRFKTRSLGYDGKGQYLVKTKKDIKEQYEQSQAKGPVPVVFEYDIRLKCELSVIVGRNASGKKAHMPITENIHRNGILVQSLYPNMLLSKKTEEQAIEIAYTIADALDVVGLITVEMFMDKDDNLYVNELAPRVHNSGHWSIQGCDISQYELLIRCICNLPLRKPRALFLKVAMSNLLGEDIQKGQEALTHPYTFYHHYGKTEARPGRKMGHVTRVDV